MIHTFICSPEASGFVSAAEPRRRGACGAGLTRWDSGTAWLVAPLCPSTASPLCTVQCICTSTSFRCCAYLLPPHGNFCLVLSRKSQREMWSKITQRFRVSKGSGWKKILVSQKAWQITRSHMGALTCRRERVPAQAHPEPFPVGNIAALLIAAMAVETPPPWGWTCFPGVSTLFPLHPASCFVCPVLFVYLLIRRIGKLSVPRGRKLYFPYVGGILHFSVFCMRVVHTTPEHPPNGWVTILLLVLFLKQTLNVFPKTVVEAILYMLEAPGTTCTHVEQVDIMISQLSEPGRTAPPHVGHGPRGAAQGFPSAGKPWTCCGAPQLSVLPPTTARQGAMLTGAGQGFICINSFAMK